MKAYWRLSIRPFGIGHRSRMLECAAGRINALSALLICLKYVFGRYARLWPHLRYQAVVPYFLMPMRRCNVKMMLEKILATKSAMSVPYQR